MQKSGFFRFVLIFSSSKVVQRKDQVIKTLREDNQYQAEELAELRKFRENILNVTSKTRPK
jgi:hypothetical protein